MLHFWSDMLTSACRSRAFDIADNAYSTGDSQVQVMSGRSRSGSSNLKAIAEESQTEKWSVREEFY
jgi:hypothetical protein